MFEINLYIITFNLYICLITAKNIMTLTYFEYYMNIDSKITHCVMTRLLLINNLFIYYNILCELRHFLTFS